MEKQLFAKLREQLEPITVMGEARSIVQVAPHRWIHKRNVVDQEGNLVYQDQDAGKVVHLSKAVDSSPSIPIIDRAEVALALKNLSQM